MPIQHRHGRENPEGRLHGVERIEQRRRRQCSPDRAGRLHVHRRARFHHIQAESPIDEATLSLDKQTVLGVGTIQTQKFTFNMVKMR